jgi:hypothetical protein
MLMASSVEPTAADVALTFVRALRTASGPKMTARKIPATIRIKNIGKRAAIRKALSRTPPIFSTNAASIEDCYKMSAEGQKRHQPESESAFWCWLSLQR